ncbi:MAG: hypothetical protein DI547_05045 [Sphingobium sp.]|nr:MAG: hypothetical protein DI547_05045 [Sphingobium sp.]
MAFLRPFLPHVLAVALILGGVWWLQHIGYQRGRADADADFARVQAAIRDNRERLETDLAGKMTDGDRTLSSLISSIDADDRTVIQPTITKEIVREARYSDPACAFTDGVFREINAARGRSACAARPDGSIECALPQPVADAGPVAGHGGADQPR